MALSQGFNIALPFLTNMGGALGIGSAAVAVSSGVASTVAVAGAVATGLAVGLGVSVWYASNGRPRDNRKQNEQYREAMKHLGYHKDDWQWRYGHDHLPNESLGFKDLIRFLKDLFGRS